MAELWFLLRISLQREAEDEAREKQASGQQPSKLRQSASAAAIDATSAGGDDAKKTDSARKSAKSKKSGR